MGALGELVKKDVRLFLADRSAAIISIAVPVGIAVFMSMVFAGGGSTSTEIKPIAIVVADDDQSPTTNAILEKLRAEEHLKVRVADSASARKMASSGETAMAVVFPKGFGERALAALSGANSRPELETLTDPSQNTTVMAAQGFVSKDVVSALVHEAYPESPLASDGDGMPFTTKTVPQTGKGTDDVTATRAHMFAGMAVQGVLFYSINLAMGFLRDRRLSIWKRIRTAPVPFVSVTLAKVLSGTIIGTITLAAVFLCGIGFMGVRVTGSPLAFVLQCLVTALMAATFGLLVASLGKTEDQSRGLSVFVVLMLSMLGGAWLPTFLMPQWMQSATLAVPSRWAIDGLDAALWRGSDLVGVLPSLAGTLGFAVLFFLVANARLKATDRSA
ncbi:MAG: ABC transporter permease [Armatimonadetes bacterium]|nr:ABC transporter permease [Armatimonadota bacterium]